MAAPAQAQRLQLAMLVRSVCDFSEGTAIATIYNRSKSSWENLIESGATDMTKASVCILAMLVIAGYLSGAMAVQATPAPPSVSLLLATGHIDILLAKAQPKQQQPKRNCKNVHSGVSSKTIQLCGFR
jgi:hypothetical protein